MKIALIGRFAKQPRYQGTGSSLMNPSQLDNLYDEMVKVAGEECILYTDGYIDDSDIPDEALIREAVSTAAKADVVVVCVGLTRKYETEGVDREHMQMPPSHNELVSRLAAGS